MKGLLWLAVQVVPARSQPAFRSKAAEVHHAGKGGGPLAHPHGCQEVERWEKAQGKVILPKA